MTTERPRLHARICSAPTQDGGWFGSADLPSEVRDGGARRLGILGLLTAATMLFFFALYIPHNHKVTRELSLFPLPMVFVGAAILLSVALFWLSRAWCGQPRRLLDFGVAYQLLMALLISLLNHAPPWGSASHIRGWSGVAVWIIIFAVFVPSRPLRTLWVSIAVALMDMAGLLITVALGNPMPGLAMWPLLFAPTLAAVATAVVAARINFRMGRRLQEVQEMGSYQLVELLGKGGMGEVWRAEHKMLARPAAIKVIRPDVLGSDLALAQQLLQRFEREAQATARLESQHTIELYDYGVDTDGAFFYVMELLDGVDLEQLVARFGPVPPGRAVHLLRQTCDSLAEAHAAGMVHRDIKPSNIQICRKALRHDVVKVLDFGLVKAGPEWTGSDDKLTAAGSITGTPAYMPPEIVDGVDSVDHRADIYALGCVAYWLLSGKALFEADSPMKMLACHINTPPQPLSERAEQTIPAPLEELIQACLAKNPAARPKDAQELARRLDALPLEQPWNEEQARAWWEANMEARSEPGQMHDTEVDPMGRTVAEE